MITKRSRLHSILLAGVLLLSIYGAAYVLGSCLIHAPSIILPGYAVFGLLAMFLYVLIGYLIATSVIPQFDRMRRMCVIAVTPFVAYSLYWHFYHPHQAMLQGFRSQIKAYDERHDLVSVLERMMNSSDEHVFYAKDTNYFAISEIPEVITDLEMQKWWKSPDYIIYGVSRDPNAKEGARMARLEWGGGMAGHYGVLLNNHSGGIVTTGIYSYVSSGRYRHLKNVHDQLYIYHDK